MRRRGTLGSIALVFAAFFAFTGAVSGEDTHVYAVSLTIAVDRPAHTINGTIVSDAPSEFCTSSTVRVRKAMPGRDKVVARIFPIYDEWRLKSSSALRGARIYAEVLRYHLPSRPVECLEARSRTVTAP